VDILVFPAAAQGERCVPENLMALQEIQDPFWACDVILLVRGGGSLEDLWGYNDSELVRAVSNCRLPIVTGVGHEIDTTLVDLAADRRAATPSQAAELVTPDRAQLLAELQRRTEALGAKMAWRLRGLETTLNLLVDRGLLRCEPDRAARERTMSLVQRLTAAHPQRRLDQVMHRFGMLKQRLLHASDIASRVADLPRVREAQRRLTPALMRLLADREKNLSVLQAHLDGLDPKGPLRRGFVLVKDEHGKLVTQARTLPEGAAAKLQWLDGERTVTMGE
jgi:exodeoxyribonuclease VII large subunit